MAGNRGTYADGPQPYHGQDPNRDISTILTAVDRIVGDLYGGQNVVLSGFALSVVSGMQIQVGAGVCYANGIYAVTGPTTLNITTTSTNPRYTIIRVTVTPNNPNGTDGTTGNSLIADTNAVDALDGTAASSPSKPTLASAYQVQVGSILLPANTTALASGMLNTLDCAPNSLYDPSPLTNSNTHRAASYAAGTTIHGIAATAPGGGGANQLAQTDANGAVGRANAGVNGSTAYFVGSPGGTEADRLAVTDASGRVGDSNKLGGVGPSGYDSAGAASAVQAALNTHESASPKTAAGVHNLIEDCGSKAAQTVNNQNASDFAIAFNFTQPDTNYRILTQWVVSSPFGVGYGGTTQVWNKTTTGCSVRVTQNSGANQSIGLDWFLIR